MANRAQGAYRGWAFEFWTPGDAAKGRERREGAEVTFFVVELKTEYDVIRWYVLLWILWSTFHSHSLVRSQNCWVLFGVCEIFFVSFFSILLVFLSIIPPIKCIRMHVATRTNERFWFTTFFLWPSSTSPTGVTVNWASTFSGDDDVIDENLVWICRWICPGCCSKSFSAISSSRYAKVMNHLMPWNKF